jgi:hypothetical protein
MMRTLGLGLGISILLLLPQLFLNGQRHIDSVENLKSIPFPKTNGSTLITEPLAHTDIQLAESTFAKNLNIEITFIPKEVDTLAIGVRENSFWFSYQPIPFYTKQSTQAVNEPQTANVTIPLTDKLADTNRTIDVIFFANPPVDPGLLEKTTINDKTQWQLLNLKASTNLVMPTLPQLKDFIRSVTTRERVL